MRWCLFGPRAGTLRARQRDGDAAGGDGGEQDVGSMGGAAALRGRCDEGGLRGPRLRAPRGSPGLDVFVRRRSGGGAGGRGPGPVVEQQRGARHGEKVRGEQRPCEHTGSSAAIAAAVLRAQQHRLLRDEEHSLVEATSRHYDKRQPHTQQRRQQHGAHCQRLYRLRASGSSAAHDGAHRGRRLLRRAGRSRRRSDGALCASSASGGTGRDTKHPEGALPLGLRVCPPPGRGPRRLRRRRAACRERGRRQRLDVEAAAGDVLPQLGRAHPLQDDARHDHSAAKCCPPGAGPRPRRGSPRRWPRPRRQPLRHTAARLRGGATFGAADAAAGGGGRPARDSGHHVQPLAGGRTGGPRHRQAVAERRGLREACSRRQT
mmetsp:Transcript_17979/g.63151  ORF Transcript_17979/g.63151 Transcript_17979/m.63151 type:complete len:375 (+) Transcript_17979:1446-2570(+)